jgi:hypothetical protein
MEHNPKLVSSEVAALWSAYMQNSLTRCIMQHFEKVNEDPDAAPLIQTAITNCNFVITEVTRIFEAENHAIPFGFTQEDVDLKANRVYSDLFTMRFIKYLSAAGTAAASAFLEVLARKDVRDFFSKTSQKFMSLFNDASDFLLKKGAFIRSPTIPPMQKAEYIQSDTFLSGLLGRHRPLTVIEMANISKGTEANSIGRTFITGFSQIAHSPEVRKFLERGVEIAAKHETVFRDILVKEDVPLPSSWDSTISQTTDSPFSDKLMMYETTSLISLSVAAYAAAISTTLRKDISADYTRLIAELVQYADDGVHIMIKNGWMEQPPQNIDREALRNRAD